ncbi:MAG: ABC transporter ATP-binding protein [Bacteroidales bacterium]|nr:MAG: ABC transporter ATP-binding protein [Bacteroidales bacterium]
MKLNPFSHEDLVLFKRTANYVKPYKGRFLLAFICVLSGIGFSLAQPLIWAKLLTSLFGQDYSTMLTMVKYMVVFFTLTTTIGFIQSYIFSTLNQKMIFDIKWDMFSKILNLPIKAFDEMRAGEFMSRLNSDASVISNIITGQFLNSIINVLRILIIGIVMFSISLKLSLVVLIAFPCTYYIFYFFGKLLRKRQSEIAKLNDSYFSTIQESVVGVREIKCLGIKGIILSKFKTLSESLKNKNIQIGILENTSSVSTQAVKFTTQVIAILLGFFLIAQGQLKVEMFIAFMSYSELFSSSLMELTKLNSNLQQALVSIGRIFELLDNLSYSIDKYGKDEVALIKGEIEFENIHFNYNSNVNVLKGISFNIKPNRKVAFVGGSGVGKTTLFNLLLRFYNPSNGSIKIDNINIEEFNEESLRKHISIVRQEPFLFRMTIKDNLLLANPNASMLELINACTNAYIHDHIVSLPDGYDSIVGERGINFSGGQRQRIAIARSFLKKSKIVLFDEATSALDNESQYAIKQAIDKLALKSTVVIIAHRLFTVIDADEIIVIDDGKVVGVGTHETLIKNNHTYTNLYKTEVDTINKNTQGILLV